MNNIERAIEIIEGEHDPYMGPIDAPSLVYAMNGAGLLAPDLPKPDVDSPFPGTSWQVYKEGGGVYTVSSRVGRVQAPGGGGGHSPAEARAMAHALLAAADHADAPTASTHTAPTNIHEGDTHDRSF